MLLFSSMSLEETLEGGSIRESKFRRLGVWVSWDRTVQVTATCFRAQEPSGTRGQGSEELTEQNFIPSRSKKTYCNKKIKSSPTSLAVMKDNADNLLFLVLFGGVTFQAKLRIPVSGTYALKSHQCFKKKILIVPLNHCRYHCQCHLEYFAPTGNA